MTFATFVNYYSALTLSHLVVLGLPVLVGAAIWADLRLPRPTLRQRIPNLTLGIGLGLLSLTLLLLIGFDVLPIIKGSLSLSHVSWITAYLAAPQLSDNVYLNAVTPFLVLAIPYLTVGLALGFFCPNTKRGRIAILLSWIFVISAMHLMNLPITELPHEQAVAQS